MEEENELTCLLPGTLLHNRFTLGDVIGSGGFSIIYRAQDRFTGNTVAIKECAPYEMVLRKKNGALRLKGEEFASAMQVGLDGMGREVEIMRKFTEAGVSGVPRYVDSFSENDTFYLAMSEVRGHDLYYWASAYQKTGEPFPEKLATSILMGTLKILDQMHQMELYHCDVKPSNIIMDDGGGLFLIDFGAVRSEEDQHVDVQVSPGYTPLEMYPSYRGHIGPWSDVYMLATLFYTVLTGRVPQPANERVQADYTARLSSDPRLSGIYSATLLNSLDKAMSVKPEDRYASAGAWIQDFETRSRGPQLVVHAQNQAPTSKPRVRTSAADAEAGQRKEAPEPQAMAADAGAPAWLLYSILLIAAAASVWYVYFA